MTEKKYLEQKWYTFLKRKYKLCDDDMEEYIDSFELINKGEVVTANILANFVNDENEENDKWTVNECRDIISNINLQINGRSGKILNLPTYMSYIIPICHEYAVTRIGIRELFDSLDTNQDGKISCDELISILYQINKNFTPDELLEYKKQIRNLCNKVDTNHDGYITYQEFKMFMINEGMPTNKQ